MGLLVGSAPASSAEQTPQRARPRFWRDALWLPSVVALVIGGFMLMVPQPHWDEAASASAATRTLPELLELLGNQDAVHGLYYLLMYAILQFGGPTLLIGRLVSLLAIVSTTLGTTMLGVRLGGRALGLTSGLVFALLPVSSHFAMQMRSQALTAAVVVWASLLLLRLLDDDLIHTRIWWFGYGLLMLAGVYLSLVVLAVVAAHVVTMVILRPPRPIAIQMMVAAASVFVLALPLVLLGSNQSEVVGGLIQVAPKHWRTVLETWTTIDAQQDLGWSLALSLVLWLSLIVGAIVSYRSRRTDTGFARRYALLLPWLLLPLLGLIVVSQFSEWYAVRFLFLCAPAFAVAAACGLVLLRPRWLTAVAIVLLFVMAIPAYRVDRDVHAKANTGDVAAFVADEARAGDGVVFLPDRRARMMALFPREFAGLRLVGVKADPIRAANFNGLRAKGPLFERNLGTVARVWFVRLKAHGNQMPASYRRALSNASYAVSARHSLSEGTVVVRYDRVPQVCGLDPELLAYWPIRVDCPAEQ
ncbi:MAG: hypothetical protein KDC39_06445 [Actinobacteria bacterium]|nr:hypothetical protein [Actinomycetota bacterium]